MRFMPSLVPIASKIVTYPPTTPVNKGKVLQFPYNGNMESSRKVAK